jgi:hypothetical protein
MDCNHARLLWTLARPPAELDPGETGYLHEHFRQCPACDEWAQREAAWDTALGQAIRAVKPPTGGQGRLLARLKQERSARLWRRSLTGMAAAAGLLLAVGVAWHFWLGAPAVVDIEETQFVVDEKLAAPQERVEAWFRDHGLHMAAPERFNYTLLHSYDFGTFANHRVAHLVFSYPGNREVSAAIADVYVLPRNQFDVDKITPPANSGRRNLELEFSEDKEFLFVIFYTGGSLDAFKKRPDA